MCELFAMSSRLPTAVSSSLEELAQHGGATGIHRDGWGMAFYDDHDVQLIREANAASRSVHLQFIREQQFMSPLVLGHIRYATQGNVALKNTQPFCRELGGRSHVFAHNGDLQDLQRHEWTPPSHFRPIGDTDSERAFCLLLSLLQDIWLADTVPPLAARLEIVREFARLMRSLGPANFIYADGEFLFIHGHQRKQCGREGFHPPGLYTLSRQCRCKSALPQSGGMLDRHLHAQKVLLVASVPLTQEAWVPLGQGEVQVIAQGDIVDSHACGRAAEPADHYR
jgi:predicted glutamine amidotransferase